MSTLQVVVGGQYGSEGKGAITHHLASQPHPGPKAVIRVAGPNAGHTAIAPDGTPWPLRTIPVAAVIPDDTQLIIAPGSEIDPDVLNHEITELTLAGHDPRPRLHIDRNATVLNRHHRETEQRLDLTNELGSTSKGIGAARAARIMRQADLYGDLDPHRTEDTRTRIDSILRHDGRIIIEGTQGYGLGLHTSNYPKCTSSDCRAIDFLAMAGISPWHPGIDNLQVYICVRPNPIRVAGNSGRLKDETTWAALGLPVELTTVTRKPRRVGGWDDDLVWEAVQANGGPPVARLALTMADHRWPDIAGHEGTTAANDLPTDLRLFIEHVEDTSGAPVELVGTGPATVLRIKR